MVILITLIIWHFSVWLFGIKSEVKTILKIFFSLERIYT